MPVTLGMHGHLNGRIELEGGLEGLFLLINDTLIIYKKLLRCNNELQSKLIRVQNTVFYRI